MHEFISSYIPATASPQIVSANVTTSARDRQIDITDVSTSQEVHFSYSVDWIRESRSYDERMNRSDYCFLHTLM
jgi:hypothetical protein